MPGNRGKNHFNETWLKGSDTNGDLYSLYISKVDEFTVKCKWCVKTFDVGNTGATALKRHSEGSRHKEIANCRMNRNIDQVVLVANTESNEEAADNPDEIVTVNEIDVSESSGPNVTTPKAAKTGSLMAYFTKETSKVVNETNNNQTSSNSFNSLNDKVAKAEILLILQAVHKNYSFQSLEGLENVIKASFNDSQIASRIGLGRLKVSYCLTEAIGPYFLKQLIGDIKKADVFVLGCDTATTQHLGLSKGLDFQVRYYSETYQKVIDAYISTDNLGHETANIMVEKCLEMMKNKTLEASKLFVISRDNPNVMKSFGNLLGQTVEKEGNPLLFESPCTLHPTHTSFKKAIDIMKTKKSLDMHLFFVNVHGWFKLSTARREDMIELRKELEEENVSEFFMRHVSSRWLTMKPTAERILKHWDSLIEYFMVFVKNSKNPSHVEARKSDRYLKIESVLKPSARLENFVRIQFAIFLCSKTEHYLKVFQSEAPLAYKLFTESCMLIAALMSSIVKENVIPKNCNGTDFINLDLDDSENLLPSKKCDFGPVVKESLKKCSDENQVNLRREFREAMLAMIKYLITSLPLSNKFLKQLSGTNPLFIGEEKFFQAMLKVATMSKRFADTELEELDTQLKMIKLAPDLPTFDEKNDTFDQFLIGKVIKKAKTFYESDFTELKKLVKMISVYPNSQAWIERGFNDTKRISTTRQSCSENVMQSSKVVLDLIRRQGAPENVPISHELISHHNNARSDYRMRLLRENREREKAAAEQRIYLEAQEKKRKFDEEKDSWSEKVKKVKSEIVTLKDTIKKQEQAQSVALSNAIKYQSQAKKDSAIKLAESTGKSIVELRSELDKQQSKLSNLMGKKPKLM